MPTFLRRRWIGFLRGSLRNSHPVLRQGGNENYSVTADKIEDVYTLSPMQAGLLFHTIYSSEAGVYLDQISCVLEGDLDPTVFEKTWQYLAERHTVLRTSFHWEGLEEQLQVVHASVCIPIEYLDWRNLSSSEQDSKKLQLLADDRRRGIDITQAPLMRLCTIRTGGNTWLLVWSIHHLIMDRWSLAQLLSELRAVYEAYYSGRKIQLPQARPYRDYIRWLRKQDSGHAEEFWKRTLAGFIAPTVVCVDRAPGGVVDAGLPAFQRADLPEKTVLALQSLAREHHLTLNTFIQGAWALLLSHYSGDEDVLFGATVAGRPASLEGVESIVGAFINTLPVRVRTPHDKPLLAWLIELQQDLLDIREYEYSSLVQIHRWSDLPGGVQMFDSAVGVQNIPISNATGGTTPALKIHIAGGEVWRGGALSLTATPGGRSLRLTISYGADRYHEDDISRMIGHLCILMVEMSIDLDRPLGRLPILADSERDQLLVEWNDTACNYPPGLCLHQLFEDQVRRTPEAVALVTADEQLTYDELNSRANQLAHLLRQQGLQPNTLVAVCMARSADMVVALIAVLKAGGAYVAVDPTYPLDRIRYTLHNASASFVITQESLLAELPLSETCTVCPDRDAGLISAQRMNDLTCITHPTDLAYVLYTSGSTGRPKGVAIEHRSPVALVRWALDQLTEHELSGVVFATSICFDLSVYELFVTLCGGGRVLLVENALAIRDLPADMAPTLINTVPSAMAELLRQGAVPSTIVRINLAGEPLQASLVDDIYDQTNVCKVYDLYGPSEDTTYSTWALRERSGCVTIGRPITNTQIYVLNRNLSPVPVGVPGELYIGGDGLARGYLNRAELTAERFVPAPFSKVAGARLYKTGDLVKYLPNGNLEYLGRLDHQVKIRGFRIELGEIESALLGVAGVREAVVLAREETPGDKRLVAYVCCTETADSPVSPTLLRERVLESLPGYMVPAVFVFLEALALTRIGNIDRNALPAPDTSRPDIDIGYVAPSNLVEKTLAEIWCAVLRLEQVGIHDNFFELGGDSILSIQIIARANAAGLQVTPRQVFQHQTIAGLATVAGTEAALSAEQGAVTGMVPVTPIQSWFFEQDRLDPHHFNQMRLLQLGQEVTVAMAQEAIRCLVSHHDALRLRFVSGQSIWEQNNAGDETNSYFSVVDISSQSDSGFGAAITSECTQLQASLNLQEGPLLRACYFNLGPQRPARLLLAIHHLCVDGVSWRILLDDLASSVSQLIRGDTVNLPAKTTSFKQWALQLTEYANSSILCSEMDYWNDVCSKPISNLPVDQASYTNTLESQATVRVYLDVDETHALLTDVPPVYHTQINDALLTALVQTVGSWTGGTGLRIDLEGHGREALFGNLDVSRTVGWFTSLYPVFLELPPSEGMGEALKAVKETLRNIPRRGIGYGLLRYLNKDDEIRTRLAPVTGAQITFNYLGQFDSIVGDSGVIRDARESAGPAISPRSERSHLLDVVAQVVDGRLRVAFLYSEGVFLRSTIEQLASTYASNLRGLIAYCSSEGVGGYTPSDFPKARASQSTIDRLIADIRSQKNETAANQIEDIYPLTPMQSGMLFHSLYVTEHAVYLDHHVYELPGDLDLTAFERAWQMLIERYSVFRTSFHWEGLEHPLQVVHSGAELRLDYQDWTGLDSSAQSRETRAVFNEHRERGFDLTQAPLMHLSLAQTCSDCWQLIWTMHHLILDRWSTTLVLNELATIYKAIREEHRIELPSSRPYGDYIGWLQQQDEHAAEIYWQRLLAGFTAPSYLPFDKSPGTVVGLHLRSRLNTRLSKESSSALHSLARRHRLTLNTLLLGAWALLLSRYRCEEDVLFGATVSGRPPSLAGIESMVGMFVNSLPVRVSAPHSSSLIDWLQKLQDQTSEMREFEYSSLVQIQHVSELPRGMPLFESLVVVQNTPDIMKPSGEVGSAYKANTLGVRARGGETSADFPLVLYALPAEQIDLSINYDGSRYNEDDIARLAGHLRTLLEGMAEEPESKLYQLKMLTQEERGQLLTDWNNTADSTPRMCIQQRFEEQVRRNPNSTALVYTDQSLTYAQLNRKANQVAHALQARGVGPDTRVGVFVERSLEMIECLLGVLKAGGAYVPLDPSYPDERLAFILEDAQTSVVITQRHLQERLTSQAVPVLCLEQSELFDEMSTANPAHHTQTDNLAYVIFTSGSTGRPKGVQICHGQVPQLIDALHHRLDVTALDVWTVFHSFAFDFSVWEIWSPLLSGGRLVVVPADVTMSPQHLYQLLASEGVTVLNLTPSVMRVLLQYRQDNFSELPGLALRHLHCGGEALPSEVAQSALSWGLPVWNFYGPTESTVWASLDEVKAPDVQSGRITVGRPFAGRRLYVLDRMLSPLPVGILGDLYIGGEGLARGYIGHPEWTAEKFVPDPFSQYPGARLYKTGDQCRYLADGRIEFVGREDYQVKVRGFRIELSEIENALLQRHDIGEAVVLVREEAPGDKRIVAYIGDAAADLTPGILREHLMDKLPAYMVPSVFVFLTSLPLTPNGKLNRSALPAPDMNLRQGEIYASPLTPVEEGITEIWKAILHLEQIGLHDNFFELGGHSLLATQVISRVRNTFQVELPLRALFEAPTVAGIAFRITAAGETGAPTSAELVYADRSKPILLSFAQQRLWFIDQFEPGSSLYNIPMAVRLLGDLRLAALQESLDALVHRHESLRTTFAEQWGEAVQIIHEPAPFKLDIIDFSDLCTEERHQEANRLRRDEAQRPFDLVKGPLFRGCLLRVSEEEHVLLLTLHHIVSDGWSQGVLRRELSALYNAFCAGKPSPLPEQSFQYADYAAWQRSWLTLEALDSQVAYWKEHLAGAPTLLDLPTDRPRPAVQTFRGERVWFQLTEELSQAVKQLGQHEGATLFMTLLAAFDVLLCRYSDQEDIVVGTPIANRTQSRTEGLIGFFINTLAVRCDLTGDPSFVTLLGRVREAALGAYSHQDLPFEKLVEELKPERSMSHAPVFQVMFTLQNNVANDLNLEGLRIERVGGDAVSAKFDLSLGFAEINGKLRGALEYNTDLFDGDRIERLLVHFRTLLESIVTDPEQPISHLSMLTDIERRQLLDDWNNTAADYERERCLHELFEAQVERTPEAVALVFEGEQLTYSQLNVRANQLAHFLRLQGVRPNTLVAICMARSVEMVVSLLAILKAGGAYVAIDPSYPVERIRYTLEDASASLLLTQDALVNQLPVACTRTLCVDRDAVMISAQPACDLGCITQPTDLAYVLYTSGSTGRPKGVAIEHHSPVALVSWALGQLTSEELSGVVFATSICFDLSVYELFVTLCGGGRVLLVENALAIGTLGTELRPSLINTVPSAMAELLRQGAVPATVMRVNLAGEPLTGSLVDAIYDQTGVRHVYDLYGPSEDTTYSTCALRERGGRVTIGRPISNTTAYVLDTCLWPSPVGVPGELYIGGDGLARGYLNRAELTAERFVPDPFSSQPGRRLYKTGDLVRYRSDGNLEYIGRLDHQVKVRGFRIELGEIENALLSYAGVHEAVVLAREDAPGDRRLVAYIGISESALNSSLLRDHLQNMLPGYMVPSAFVVLETLPLTPNGKIDRRALPAPDSSSLLVDTYVAARTPIEEGLAEIWRTVLKVEQIGIHHNFFELGGHSLLATQVMSRVRQAFQVELSVRALFEAPTIAGLAELTLDFRRSGAGLLRPPITRVSRDGLLPLSFAQQRLWFVDRMYPGSSLYNVPGSWRIRGAMDVDALQRALDVIVGRHEALRTTFIGKDGTGTQLISSDTTFPLTVVDLSGMPESERKAEIRSLSAQEAGTPFDLTSDRLIRGVLIRVSEFDHLLLTTSHHIVSDGVSMGVFLDELSSLYSAFQQGIERTLPPLPVQYADFAVWQRSWLQGDVLVRHANYWTMQLAGSPPLLDLPTDRLRETANSQSGDFVSRLIPTEINHTLQELSREERASQFMTLLAIFNVLLYSYTNQQDIIVGTDDAGRNHADLERLIGFFVNHLVLRTDLSGNPSFRELLCRVREMTLDAYTHQDMPFDKLVELLRPDREASYSPLFQVLFVMQPATTAVSSDTGFSASGVGPGLSSAKYDIVLFVKDTPAGLATSWLYRTDLFDADTILGMAADYESIVRCVASSQDVTVADLRALVLDQMGRRADIVREERRKSSRGRLLARSHQPIDTSH